MYTLAMHLILFAAVLTLRTRVSDCFNIEDRNPIVKKAGEGQNGSHFGFSVAQHAVKEDHPGIQDHWILVGAPLGKNLQPGSNHSGALFKCPVTGDQDDCVQVVTDGKRLDNFDYDYDQTSLRQPEVLQPPGNDEIKEDQWLGVTVRSQKPGGKVVVCAHRYIQSPNLNQSQYGMGLCYLLSNNLEIEDDLQPCKGRPTEKEHQQFGYCQVGTSLAVLDDGFTLMGSPGPYTWRGTVFAKDVVGSFLDRDKTVYKGPLNDNPTPIDKYSYLGMSVTGGRFFDGNMTYVSGAPRAEFAGKVFFFRKKKSEEDMEIVLIIPGEQFGSSFGYEILAVDVDEDGFDDLLVSAPFFYGKDEGGAVYVFDDLRRCLGVGFCNYSMVLRGKRESRFGFALTALGDINKDGYTDVAVGAPYEDGGGAIYIYLGSKDGLSREPSQKIKHPTSGITTLGYSLSGGLDMDDNGYPDLLAGAFDSDRAILYKTRPIIDITIDIVGKELRNINATKKGCAADPDNLNKTCFSFQSCFTLSKFKFDKAFEVRYDIKELPKKIPRVTFSETSTTRYIQINRQNVLQKHCQDETVYLVERNGDILSPIKFIVNYTLHDNSVDSPILNKTSVKEFEATFQKSCGDDDICKSNLVLQAGASLEKSEDGGYILDLSDKREFLLEANVSNLGESAYEAKLFVFHPEALSYVALQAEKNKTSNVVCTSNNESTIVTCNLGNPLQGNKTLNLRIRFEIKETKQPKLNITVFVNSTSYELSKQTKQSFTATLQRVAHYAISGKQQTPNVFFSGEVKGQSAMRSLEDVGPKVYHGYDVINLGQWNIRDVEVVIWWPYQVYSERPQGGKWLLYIEKPPMIDQSPVNYCEVDPSNAVNPLHLNSSGLEEDVVKDNLTGDKGGRRKRDADDVVQPEIETGKDGKQRKTVTMDCAKKTAKCVRIVCKIPNLRENSQIKIQVFSRIWNSTLIEDYSKVDWIRINSIGEVNIDTETTIHHNDSVKLTKVETVAYPETVVADTSLNIWIIVGSVLAGLILLIILVLILYKLGFFKRNRIKDHTLSGNLRKQGESETLLKEGEGKATKSAL